MFLLGISHTALRKPLFLLHIWHKGTFPGPPGGPRNGSDAFPGSSTALFWHARCDHPFPLVSCIVCPSIWGRANEGRHAFRIGFYCTKRMSGFCRCACALAPENVEKSLDLGPHFEPDWSKKSLERASASPNLLDEGRASHSKREKFFDAAFSRNLVEKTCLDVDATHKTSRAPHRNIRKDIYIY